MHAPASVSGLRRRLAVPAALRRRPGMPRGPLLVAAATIAGLVVLGALILVYTPIAHPKTLTVTGVTGPSEARITRLLEEAGAKQSTFAVSDKDLMRAVAAYPEVAGVERNIGQGCDRDRLVPLGQQHRGRRGRGRGGIRLLRRPRREHAAVAGSVERGSG